MFNLNAHINLLITQRFYMSIALDLLSNDMQCLRLKENQFHEYNISNNKNDYDQLNCNI
ncbi:hypothetical protein pb186bvf_017219 [Paramecium bursaria]